MGFLRKLRSSFHSDRLNQDAADELAFHLEQRTRDLIAAGLPAREAELKARRQLGNSTLMQENTTESDLFVWLDGCRRDLRLGFRTLWKSRLFAIMAVLSIALGIGANTTIFTVTKHVVLDSLPVPNADQLVLFHNPGTQEGHVSSDGMQSSFSYPLYLDLNNKTSSVFGGILARAGASAVLTRSHSSDLINCELVSGNYFQVLGVQPWRGRLLTPADNLKPGAHPVVVLSYGLWQREFGADPKLLNSSIRLNGHPFQVIGIAPPSFYGLQIDTPAGIYAPLMMAAQIAPDRMKLDDRLDHWASLVGRMRPGITLGKAEAALSVLYPRLRDQDLPLIHHLDPDFLSEFKREQIHLTPGGQGYADTRERLRKPLLFLDSMVLLVLLITLVNVANLLIARSSAREREMAVRLSVGAGRGVLIRQLLIESLTLAFVGGALGIALAYLATPLLLRVLGSDLSSASIRIYPDSFVLLLTAGLTIVSGIAFGLLPALQSSRADTASALKADGSFGHTTGRLWLRRSLVAGQIGFSLVLLTAALLFSKSLSNLQNINPGFNTHHLLTFKVAPLQAGYGQARIRSFGENLRHRLHALPGVENVSVASIPVLEGWDWSGSTTVEGYQAKHGDAEALRNEVSPQFFETLQIRLLSGRTLTESDSLPTHKFAVVNSAFVRQYFGKQNPLGRHFKIGAGVGPLDWTIAGVVVDSEHSSLRSKIQPMIYMPYLISDHLSSLAFYVRTAGDTTTLTPMVRQTVHSLDGSLPVYDVSSVDDIVAGSLVAEHGLAILSTIFAGLAVLLAIVGLYGVVAYSVTRRRREFGIRMAVGATPGRVLNSVLRETALLGGISILCTLPLMFAAGRFVSSLLYEVKPANPVIAGTAAALLFAVAVLAGLIPARTASRIDPQTALRGD